MQSDNIITEKNGAEEPTEDIKIEENSNIVEEEKVEITETQDSKNIEEVEEILNLEAEIEEEKDEKISEIKEEYTEEEKSEIKELEKTEEVEESLNLEIEEEKTENKVEDIVVIKDKREPKDITVLVDDSMLVESGIEIKYTSLQLKNFPIVYSNFSKDLSFNEVISVGTSTVKIGDILLNNANMKILVYDKFKLLEIKTREFKIGLSIDLINGELLVKDQDFYKYEIFNKIKTSRFAEVIAIFKEIFKGSKIEFKYKKLMGEIYFENRIEVYKFTVLEEMVNSYKNIVSELSLNREKSIMEVTNNFYEIFLTEHILKSEKFDSWVNFRLKNNYDIQENDGLKFERIHKLNFKGINFDIKEIIKVKEKVSQREITQDNEICSYRKAVEISLEKLEKNS